MASVRYRKYTKKSEYSIIYSGLRGVDFSGDGSQISRGRLALCENMYRDYDGDGGDCLETIPGYRIVYELSGTIKSLHLHSPNENTKNVVIQSANKLYVVEQSALDNGGSYTSSINFTGDIATSFAFDRHLFLFNGENCVCINPEAYIYPLTPGAPSVYIPTTYVNGIEFEQRNMLTRYCYESYVVSSADINAYGTPELEYLINDVEKKVCRVVGINESFAGGDVYIPSRIKLGDEYYTVEEIGNNAFNTNNKITSLYTAKGLKRIGKLAFSKCANLKKVVLSDSVEELDNAAFGQCMQLSDMHVGKGLRRCSDSVLVMCTSLTAINYAGSAAEFALIENNHIFGDNIAFDTDLKEGFVGVPIFGPVTSILSVSIDGRNVAWDTEVKDGLIKFIRFHLLNKSQIEGKEIKVFAQMSDNYEHYTDRGGFMSGKYASAALPQKIIYSSTVSAVYDSRPFLSGSAYCPNLVFFATRDRSGLINPMYFGENDFFDAYSETPVVAMLPTSDSLAIFTRENDSSITISYHTPESTEMHLAPRIYPISYSHRGLHDVYGCCSFFDDAVFLSKQGLIGLDKRKLNLDKNITVRSHNVNKHLLSCDFSDIKMCVWRGYLLIGSGDKIYMADSRQSFTNDMGGTEYEWFCLCDIGTYTNDSPVYRYSSTAPSGHLVNSEKCELIVDSNNIFSQVIDSQTYYYTLEGGNKYSVYQTGERQGGRLHPPTSLLSFDDMLYFSTDNGKICKFNNDMRGIPSDVCYLSEDFDADEYRKLYGRKINPEHYSFASHAIKQRIKTPLDNGNIPHMSKSTVKHSLTIKCGSTEGASIYCDIYTDTGSYKELCRFAGSNPYFDSIDFSSMQLTGEYASTIAISEKEKDWVEKQIILRTDSYCAPFSLHNIAYRFYVRGKIK